MAEPYKHIYKVDLNQPLKRFDVGDILASGDEKANSFEVAVSRDGANVDLSGCAVYGYFIRPNDETMKVDGTVDGNIVRVEPSKNCYVYYGAFSLAVKLTGNGITQTVAVFDGRIVRTTSDNIVDGDRVIYGLEDLLAQIAAVENATVNADAAASNANTAATNADTATTRANQAAASIENVTASATELDAGAEATATVTEVDGAKHFSFGIPRGERGEKGEKGDPGNVDNVTITSIAGLPEALAGKQPVGNYLTADGTAADASKLGGKLPEAYATKENLEQYATKEDLENLDIPDTENVPWEKVTDKPDHIVDQGTSGVWSYRKWESGIAECWFNVTHKIDSFEAVWGNLYESDEYFPAYEFPFTIYEVKSEAVCATAGLGVIVASRSRTNLKASPPLIFARPQNTTSGCNAFVGYNMVGTWKE